MASDVSNRRIWCLESHCPESARDADPQATNASCRAMVHNLAGFVSRSRPARRFREAEEYYFEALGYVMSLLSAICVPIECLLSAL